MSSSDIFIAVIGVTGAGKTTFISKATGREDLEIGHGIESCTSEIKSYTFTLDGKKVTLIDTPGFDDSEVSDADILKRIATSMHKSYTYNQLLSAVIYMQPINGNRCMGSEKKRTRLFKQILGPEAYARVIIATTMWDSMKDETTAELFTQERAGKADVWGDMVGQGARIMRHDDNTNSAQNLLRAACGLGGRPVALQLQKELSKSKGALNDTSAKRQLDEDLGETVKKLRAEMDELRRELATSREDRAALSEELEELQTQVIGYESQRSGLADFVVKIAGKYMDPFLEFVVVPVFKAFTEE